MMGARIVMDEEKILSEGTYCLDDIYFTLDKFAKECNLIRRDKYTYICRGGSRDLADMYRFAYLENSEWFTDNVKEWIWLDDEDENVDILEKRRKRSAFA